MDLDSIEGLNEIRPSVYRASMKLLSLQRLCHMDVVSVHHVTAAFLPGRAQQYDVGLNRQEVTRTLNRMFQSVSQEVPGHVTMEDPEETCSLMFRLYDCRQSGRLSAGSLQTALIALSADTLLAKYRALVSVAETSSGSISRSGLRSLLQDLSQVPAAVQEGGVFGGVEVAVRSCFNRVLTPSADTDHVMSWLQSEPRLLLWLPTMYRLSASQSVRHGVRCHTCKTFPITGLRYRCMKCVNVHVCQSCFLTDRHTRKHKPHHPVLEFCTQPTWRESLSSLVHSARHVLLPRRYTRREADKRGVLMWEEPGETTNSAPPPSAVSHSPASDPDVYHDASVRPPPCSVSSKALQTDEDPPSQQPKAAALLTEVRTLQSDKWLLEQQLQAWRLTVQSEQGILEDRCSEMEVTMETLREHNLHLQETLAQVLNKMEAQHQANNMAQRANTEGDNITPMSDTEEEEDEDTLLKMEDEWSEEEQTPSPIMHLDTPPSHDLHCDEEEESADDRSPHHPTEQEDRAEEAGQQDEDGCMPEEDCGTCSPEELLQETVERLRSAMKTYRWTERQTGERKRAELLAAAGLVGDSIHRLVEAVGSNSDEQVTRAQVIKGVYLTY